MLTTNYLNSFKILLSSILVFCLSVNFAYCQNKQTIDSIQKSYQSCLDNGQFMSGCSKSHYQQMDSLLNVVYSKLRLKIDSVAKIQLKKEQKEWLLKRDNYFKENQKQISVTAAQDDLMEMYDKDADFVKERVLHLIERYEKLKKK